MAERKVINKYYPPDFDPSLVHRGMGGGGARSHKVRLMAPFSMRCNSCGEYIYKGKKFNARKDIVWNEEYLGIKVYRFFIRCPTCANEISFKTDPKNSDYVCEDGASRNFEAWREEAYEHEANTFRKQLEEEMDPMRKLENKTIDAKREIQILEALDELKTRNARNETINADVLLDIRKEEEQHEQQYQEALKKAQEEEDARLARQVFEASDGSHVKRLLDEDEVEVAKKKQMFESEVKKALNSTAPKKKLTAKSLGIKIRKK